MLLRLLPIALLACALFAVAVAPEANATCLGVEQGASCVGVYDDCPLTQDCRWEDTYVCVGLHDGYGCLGVAKP